MIAIGGRGSIFSAEIWHLQLLSDGDRISAAETVGNHGFVWLALLMKKSRPVCFSDSMALFRRLGVLPAVCRQRPRWVDLMKVDQVDTLVSDTRSWRICLLVVKSHVLWMVLRVCWVGQDLFLLDKQDVGSN